MTPVADEARAVWGRLQNAKGDLAGMVLAHPFGLGASEADTELQNRLQDAIGRDEAEFEKLRQQARQIKDKVEESARTNGQTIRTAADRSPTADQNWFEAHLESAGHWIDEKGEGARNWIGEHADVIRTLGKIASGLGKVVMAIGALAALLGAPFMPVTFGLSEAPAGLIMTIGGALWAGGDLAQTAADWGERKIDGKDLIVDAALAGITSLPAGGAVKIVGKVADKVFSQGLQAAWPARARRAPQPRPRGAPCSCR